MYITIFFNKKPLLHSRKKKKKMEINYSYIHELQITFASPPRQTLHTVSPKRMDNSGLITR